MINCAHLLHINNQNAVACSAGVIPCASSIRLIICPVIRIILIISMIVNSLGSLPPACPLIKIIIIRPGAVAPVYLNGNGNRCVLGK